MHRDRQYAGRSQASESKSGQRPTDRDGDRRGHHPSAKQQKTLGARDDEARRQIRELQSRY